MATVSAIVCTDYTMGIGYNGSLIHRSPIDMAFFIGLTQNCVVVGGRKTMEGIKTLPNRKMVVVTNHPEKIKDPSRYFAIITGDELGSVKHSVALSGQHIVIIGGEEIYRQFADQVQHLYMTTMFTPLGAALEADAWFPLDAYGHLDTIEALYENTDMAIQHIFKR